MFESVKSDCGFSDTKFEQKTLVYSLTKIIRFYKVFLVKMNLPKNKNRMRRNMRSISPIRLKKVYENMNLSTFPDISELKKCENLSFAHNNIVSFETLPKLNFLRKLCLDFTKIETFEKAQMQPNLISISLIGTKLQKYERLNLMCVSVFGDKIRRVNNVSVCQEDIFLGKKLRYYLRSYLFHGWILVGIDKIYLYNPKTDEKKILQMPIIPDTRVGKVRRIRTKPGKNRNFIKKMNELETLNSDEIPLLRFFKDTNKCKTNIDVSDTRKFNSTNIQKETQNAMITHRSRSVDSHINGKFHKFAPEIETAWIEHCDEFSSKDNSYSQFQEENLFLNSSKRSRFNVQLKNKKGKKNKKRTALRKRINNPSLKLKDEMTQMANEEDFPSQSFETYNLSSVLYDQTENSSLLSIRSEESPNFGLLNFGQVKIGNYSPYSESDDPFSRVLKSSKELPTLLNCDTPIISGKDTVTPLKQSISSATNLDKTQLPKFSIDPDTDSLRTPDLEENIDNEDISTYSQLCSLSLSITTTENSRSSLNTQKKKRSKKLKAPKLCISPPPLSQDSQISSDQEPKSRESIYRLFYKTHQNEITTPAQARKFYMDYIIKYGLKK